MKRLFGFLVLIILMAGCGSGGIFTRQPGGVDTPAPDSSYTTPWGNVTITKDAFLFGSDYPVSVTIPDVDGMRSTAFVVSFFSPSGVLAIDLDSSPLQLSTKFTGVISPSGTGMPAALWVQSATRAFLLTSSHIIDFNPMSGTVNTTFALLKDLKLSGPMPISSPYDVDGDGSTESAISTIEMSYPASITAIGDKLYVTMSNLINPIMPAVAAPGVVRVLSIKSSAPYIVENTKPIITSDFNPTGLTPLPSGLIAVTNSGVSDIVDGAAKPLTNSSIDFINAMTNSIEHNISMGPSALSFQQMAVTNDGKRAYIGSVSYGETYEIDLETMTSIYTHTDPITITSNAVGSDFLSAQVLSHDDKYLFVASFDNSSIYPVDITTLYPTPLPTAFSKPFVLGFPKGVSAENPTGGNTGVGSIVVRPGAPGVDFTGPDLFALTGSPGTLVTIQTYGASEVTTASTLRIKSMKILPQTLEVEGLEKNFQLWLNVKFEDSNKTSSGTQRIQTPYSGYPVRVRWSSSNPDVATIDDNATITPVSEGETIISAIVGSEEIKATLLVAEAPKEPVKDDPKEPKEDPREEPADNPKPKEDPKDNPDDKPKEEPKNKPEDKPAPKEDIKILTEAPNGTDPFADKVYLFTPGKNSGFGTDKMPEVVLGPPEGEESGNAAGLDVLSLGNGGEIILEMTDFIIADGDGPDFTVFENVFYAGGNKKTPFSEPAIVSVSEDGKKYYSFACDLKSKPLYPGCAGTIPTLSSTKNGIDPTDPKVSGGNQFDLADVGLEIARFVKITDGGIPGFGGISEGFDLDAIAVVNGTILE